MGIISAMLITFSGHFAGADSNHELVSTNTQIAISVHLPASVAENPAWSATFRGKPVFDGCRLSLDVHGEGDMLTGVHLRAKRLSSLNKRVRILFGKAADALDRYRESRFVLETRKRRRIDIVFRCYNDAVAFRCEIPKQDGMRRVTVADEGTSFGISGNPVAYVQYLENYRTSHEHNVTTTPLHGVRPDTLIDMPATFAFKDGAYLALTEASLRRYAGMSLIRSVVSSAKTELVCRLAPRPDGSKVVGDLPLITPWRVALLTDRAGGLLESNTLYCLNEPSAIGDTGWIKPGKMTWSWWNGNLYDGKPAEPILSLQMARKYIDFCVRSGIAYHSVIADETDTPWYFQSNKGVVPGADTDATRPRDGLDLAGIRAYAELKGVRLWTWVHQAALRGRVEEAFAAYEKLGWSGMMIDFFDHDDQETVEFAEEILKAAARHHVMIHFHGIWKPTGLQRTYPNLMNHEGALNLEYLKWSDRCTPEHNLLMAFTRMVAGPMDYHLGGFRSVNRADFKPIWAAPNVLGTRCHHLATYVCFDNPNPMLSDYPTAYDGQPGFDFLEMVPTWWDETRILMGDVGEILVTARRKGKTWYLGCMSAKKARDLDIPLSFLGIGKFAVRLWTDAPDANRDPNHLTYETSTAKSRDRLRVRVSLDGGFVAQITPIAGTPKRR